MSTRNVILGLLLAGVAVAVWLIIGNSDKRSIDDFETSVLAKVKQFTNGAITKQDDSTVFLSYKILNYDVVESKSVIYPMEATVNVIQSTSRISLNRVGGQRPQSSQLDDEQLSVLTSARPIGVENNSFSKWQYGGENPFQGTAVEFFAKEAKGHIEYVERNQIPFDDDHKYVLVADLKIALSDKASATVLRFRRHKDTGEWEAY